jgi:A/G-specific adenine glycosylase
MTPQQLRKKVWAYYDAHGRHDLPWRKTKDAYKIMVSEIMLQQTQVDRVRPFYKELLEQFPTIGALAAAPLGDVLRAWQGLGYNRRAKMLHQAAQMVVNELGGKMPKSIEGLQVLPGIGPYTARAIAAFAYNHDTVFVETNLRTVVLHEFFPARTDVPDAEILAVLERAYPKSSAGRGARDWYAALMDYGAFLKRSGVRTNARAKAYTKQSTFTGSSRQARGAVLRALAKGPLPLKRLTLLLGDDRVLQMVAQIGRLYKEGLIEKEGTKYRLPR